MTGWSFTKKHNLHIYRRHLSFSLARRMLPISFLHLAWLLTLFLHQISSRIRKRTWNLAHTFSTGIPQSIGINGNYFFINLFIAFVSVKGIDLICFYESIVYTSICAFQTAFIEFVQTIFNFFSFSCGIVKFGLVVKLVIFEKTLMLWVAIFLGTI